ncbi:fumarylacetoacetate hydrolase family protein [Pseudonocardia lacus]|uniref:fumarylacetoacetate hydrolase family protein n=1 Tax=Pseudonocardia lacus TaxID=2835865 RepID=UPI001BDC4002|nr:fumarylacetoacetate hydrolase family protein [Pseudonocardia lacus]
MRFAAWTEHDATRVGLLDGETLHALPPGTDLVDLLADAPTSLADAAARARAGGETRSLAEVALTAPLRPPAVRDFIAFEQHIEGMALGRGPGETGNPGLYEIPVFYFSNPNGVVGPHDDVPVPPGCELFDFELEVAAVIGRAGRDLTPEQAREHIAGYLIFNDWSARDTQLAEMALGFGPVKGKDSATTLGPWLVTADELEPHRRDGRFDLRMAVSVNGVEIGSDTLANMAWRFEDLVAYASRGAWVRPGDVLGSGTCGNGCLMELWHRRGSRNDPPPLRVGDVVEMTVQGIGTIRNRVVAGADPLPIPPARRASDVRA